MSRPKVVIIGAGFGGLQCARALEGSATDVIVIDKNNYHLFTPLLYQVASSLLNPSDIAYPIRSVLRSGGNVRFIMAKVDGADFGVNKLRTADGSDIPYDYLVIAAGSQTNYFAIPSVHLNAHGLKDLPEALELRNHILSCIESASREPDAEARRKWLSFVVVGAGPTGVEFVGALSELVRVVSLDFPEIDMGEVRITLVEALDQALPSFPNSLGVIAREELERRGIKLLLGERVSSATPEGVLLKNGTEIAARTLVWAAGVKPSALAQSLGLPLHSSGRIEVEPTLRVKGHDRLYAVGDIASLVHDGREIPMLAPPAMQQGRHAACNILRSVQGQSPLPFGYHDPGSMATIGRNAGVVSFKSLQVSGFLGWLTWLFVHLYFLIGFRNRLVVLAGWAWDYFRFDRPVRMILRAADRK